MKGKGVSVVLTGSFGPNAVQVFKKGGIKVITGISDSVTQAVLQFSAGSLKTAPAPQNGGDLPQGTGMGTGRGMGGGPDNFGLDLLCVPISIAYRA